MEAGDRNSNHSRQWRWLPTESEAADCAIIAYVLAAMGGFDLHELMRDKLAVLVERADQQAERDRERGIED